jgi:hypothetical protein
MLTHHTLDLVHKLELHGLAEGFQSLDNVYRIELAGERLRKAKSASPEPAAKRSPNPRTRKLASHDVLRFTKRISSLSSLPSRGTVIRMSHCRPPQH